MGGRPLANPTVTLWAASSGDPKQLAQVTTASDRRFEMTSQEDVNADAILYTIVHSNNSAGDLLSVLGHTPPAKVVINELTTVASAFTGAWFINGESISGSPPGLKIAAGNVPNLVDPATGTWGKVLLDPINITQSTTMANLNTLGLLLSAFITGDNDDWRDRFIKAAANGLHRRALLRRWPTSPVSPGLARRNSSLSSIRPIRNRRMAVHARPRSGLNGALGVFDFNGHPIGKESDFPLAGRVGGLQGVGIAANGDVWIADATKNQLLYFPGGRVKDARLVQVKGLKSPFGIAIDAQNRVWVSNAQSFTVVRFPADDPSKVESFRAGIGVRGVAMDSKGNLWVASKMSLGFPPPVIPDGVSVMRQFQFAGEHLLKTLKPGQSTGVVNMIRPDGTQPAPQGFTGHGLISVPWGVSIDGNDDVWVANFWGRGLVLMAGADPKGNRSSTKTGDVVHVFTGGTIQMLTDVVVDPAGDVWAANNWNSPEAAVFDRPPHPISTWGGGSGLTVIYGVAAPVKAPLMGPVLPN